MKYLRSLTRIFARRRFASGGTLPARSNRDVRVSMVSPGRSTVRRPGESYTEAMNRLMRGEDL